MMLTIHGFPPNFKYHEVKILIQEKCKIHDFILDTLVSDVNGCQKIRVGTTDDMEAQQLIKCLDMYRLPGNFLLKVIPVSKPVTQNVSPQNSFERSNYGHPKNDFSQNSSTYRNLVSLQGRPMNQGDARQISQGDRSFQRDFRAMDHTDARLAPFVNERSISQDGRPIAQRDGRFQQADERIAPWAANTSSQWQRPMAQQPQNNFHHPQQQVASQNPSFSSQPNNRHMGTLPGQRESGDSRGHSSYSPLNQPVTIMKDNFQGSTQYKLTPGLDPQRYKSTEADHQQHWLQNQQPKPHTFGKPAQSSFENPYEEKRYPNRPDKHTDTPKYQDDMRRDYKIEQGRRMSPQPRQVPPGRHAAQSGRPVSPPGRHSGRDISPPGRHSGRAISPPGRRMPSTGRAISPPARHISQTGRPLSPSGRHIPSSGRPISPPGRHISQSGRHISPTRRISPSAGRVTPEGDRRGRGVSPHKRRASPYRRHDPSRNTRYSPSSPSRDNAKPKLVRPAYEPPQAPNQAMYSGGFRPNVHEEVRYPSQGARPVERRESPWQQNKNPYPIKKEEERGQIRIKILREEPVPDPKQSSPRKSRSPVRRDRSPPRDRYKKHSPSPRSPRRSWALEKRRSPEVHEAPPPPMWPGQSRDEKFNRDSRPQMNEEIRPNWVSNFEKRSEDERQKSDEDRRTFDDRRMYLQKQGDIKKSHEDFETHRRPEGMPYDRKFPERLERGFRSEREPYQDDRSRRSPQRQESKFELNTDIDKDFEDIYKKTQEFKRRANELRKSGERKKIYEREEVKYEKKDYRDENRERSEYDNDWKKKREMNLAAVNIKEKKKKAVEELSKKIMDKHVQAYNLTKEQISRAMDELKLSVSRNISEMFGERDVSFIEIIIKYQAKYNENDDKKMLGEIINSMPSYMRNLKRPIEDKPAQKIKISKWGPASPQVKGRREVSRIRPAKEPKRDNQIKEKIVKPEKFSIPKLSQKVKPPEAMEQESSNPVNSVNPVVLKNHELNPMMTRLVESELQDIMIKIWSELPDTSANEAENLVVDKFRNHAGDDFKNALGLNITKRLLNVFNPLIVKVRFSGKPEREHLSSFLKKYNFTAFKRMGESSTKVIYAARLKSINDYDRLFATDTVHCGGVEVTVTPCYKFLKCPSNLKTSFDNFHEVGKDSKRSRTKIMSVAKSPKNLQKHVNVVTAAKRVTSTIVADDKNSNISCTIPKVVTSPVKVPAKTTITGKTTLNVEKTAKVNEVAPTAKISTIAEVATNTAKDISSAAKLTLAAHKIPLNSKDNSSDLNQTSTKQTNVKETSTNIKVAPTTATFVLPSSVEVEPSPDKLVSDVSKEKLNPTIVTPIITKVTPITAKEVLAKAADKTVSAVTPNSVKKPVVTAKTYLKSFTPTNIAISNSEQNAIKAPLAFKGTKGKSINSQNKFKPTKKTKAKKVENDFDELDDQDILALISGKIDLDA